MARSSMQKQKLLYLRKIMLEKTDENHGLTLNEIIAELASRHVIDKKVKQEKMTK